MTLKFHAVIVVLFVAIAVLVGCKDSKNPQADLSDPQSYKTVTKAQDFLKLYKEWTLRLESLAGKTNDAYNEWSGGIINTEVFLDNVKKIYSEMKQLNKETDLNTDFKLSENDKRKVNYDAITKAYAKASKDLNDFLFVAPRLSDDKIKTEYDKMIKTKYANDLSELKSLLKI